MPSPLRTTLHLLPVFCLKGFFCLGDEALCKIENALHMVSVGSWTNENP